MPNSSFLKLSLFVAGDPADTPTAAVACSPTACRSRRSFADGAVGLGIVAAISGGGGRGRPAALTRSEPIPISPTRALAAARPPEPDEGALSESYTCVISHVGGNSVRKRVYFGDGSEVVTMDVRRRREVIFETPPPIPPPKPAIPFAAMDLLSHCHLCKKKLEGIDIYMYRTADAFPPVITRVIKKKGSRSSTSDTLECFVPSHKGDKAFCSPDCRCQQMLLDAHRENCGSEVLNSFECSLSPCSFPLLFAAGVAAA
ncbi:FCS-Like Zinc finger 13-like isoform X1 [Phoenix dactylifera]|uniref:FCS-Like Zinc finger 13-like isoform X1 n=1 Tax=Phoenix dactylifera TaxID=42345 RepID=A0A8B8J1R6_PHODC|nr:FCS-Like Zinc finger 13-like isoform X1 [Phoenix dactylifera]